MPIYQFYALIEPRDDSFFVKFPDIESCFTEGTTLSEAVNLAEETLGVYLSFCEDERAEIPKASPLNQMEVIQGTSLVLVQVNTDHFKGRT
ncbi:putative RNase H-like HicB family nuclease [Peribacillus deserti]|uniref:RNase H-like HicB family nuclease n=1 Tax=Peribacillus deserti TaxID=673318 RepID=A0ABS2QKZ7_9BACI|nr:type II toxin-antitoxin system HicB family antitoxin [Peribacillus deserti]MBM7693849.1 putative RNase H-like HicB family nuclease [Peribacillus deserti]